jgi:hypothetical protein
MTTAPKPKWKGFDQLLCELADAMDKVLGDKDASLHAARHVMLLFLKNDAWLARTSQPEGYVFDHGGHSVPLDQMDTLNSHFWRYYEAAEETGEFREALARGGPWAEWQFGVDDFAFGLPDDPAGPIVGRVRDVQVWARTGKFSKQHGRPTGTKAYPVEDELALQEAIERISAGESESQVLKSLAEVQHSQGVGNSVKANRTRLGRALKAMAR